jgi:prophage regulatory protein
MKASPLQDRPDDLLTIHDVLHRTKLSRPTIYRYIAAKRFPAPLKLSAGAVRWRRGDLDAWQAHLSVASVTKA